MASSASRGAAISIVIPAFNEAARIAITVVRTLDYLAVPEDRLALEALALERTMTAAAIARWEAYLSGAGGQGPWATAARARLDALRRGAGGGWPVRGDPGGGDPRSGGVPAREDP